MKVEVFKQKDAPFWSGMADNVPDFNVHQVLGQQGYEATCDMPSAKFYKEQMIRYPDAKVILTLRDPEKWYKSCMDTIFLVQPDMDRCGLGVRTMMGLGMPSPGMAEMVTARKSSVSFQT